MNKKSVLITGVAFGGIGMATAEKLAQNGYRLYLNGRDHSKLEPCISQITKAGGEAKAVICDISDPEQVTIMMQTILEDTEGLDAFIHSAALAIPHTPIEHIINENWDSELAVILSGAFYVCRAAIPSMKKRGNGSIVFISSIAGMIGSHARSLHYSTAKAGLNGMARHLALELAPYNIRVNAIAPTLVDTSRTRLHGRHNQESLDSYGKQNVPLGRVGKPEDVANLIAFLVSQESNYLTGQVINLDGGSLLARPGMKPKYNK